MEGKKSMHKGPERDLEIFFSTKWENKVNINVLLSFLLTERIKEEVNLNNKSPCSCLFGVFRYILFTGICEVALKVMPRNLLCWPMTSEVNVGGMAEGVEPAH